MAKLTVINENVAGTDYIRADNMAVGEVFRRAGFGQDYYIRIHPSPSMLKSTMIQECRAHGRIFVLNLESFMFYVIEKDAHVLPVKRAALFIRGYNAE